MNVKGGDALNNDRSDMMMTILMIIGVIVVAVIIGWQLGMLIDKIVFD